MAESYMTQTSTADRTSFAMPVPNIQESQKLKFTGTDRFLRELRKRVDAYFEATGKKRRDCPAMYFKTASIMAWFISAYVLLLFVVHSWWLVLPLAVVLG